MDRWTYLQDGRPRAGRSRHLLDFFEQGSRVALALDMRGAGEPSHPEYRGMVLARPSTWIEREPELGASR